MSCLFPIHIYYAMGILGEAFGFFAIASFVYLWIKIIYTHDYSSKDFFYLGLSLVLLYGIKPIMIPFIGVFMVYLFFCKFKIYPNFSLFAFFLAFALKIGLKVRKINWLLFL